MRVGHGYDLHRFDPESGPGDISLGGVQIQSKQRVIAHSDGDVLIHALCDALLGAMALGDLGEHFPDSDPRWKNVSGAELLKNIAGTMAAGGWALGNADLTVICEQPQVSMHRTKMCEAIATALSVNPQQISVKATTAEGTGPIGRGEAIAAHAVVLLHAASREGE